MTDEEAGKLLERPFAHMLETGGTRRIHLRCHDNILKHVLMQAAAANLGLLMRTLFGVGTPRSLQGRAGLLAALAGALSGALSAALAARLTLRFRLPRFFDSIIDVPRLARESRLGRPQLVEPSHLRCKPVFAKGC